MTNTTDYDILNKLSLETNECLRKRWQTDSWKAGRKKIKKFLTNVNEYDKLNEPILNGETKRTLIIKQ